MKPIEGILPGSKIKAYAYHQGFDKPMSWTFTLEKDGRLWCNDEWMITWDEIELTEIAAFDKYVERETQRVEREIDNLNNLKAQRDNYRDPEIVAAEKLAHKTCYYQDQLDSAKKK